MKPHSLDTTLLRKRILDLLVLPFVFYSFWFFLLSYPALLVFNTHFLSDLKDGAVNLWILWWFNEAVTQPHLSLWHTTFIHYPYGMSLVGSVRDLFNAASAFFLLKHLTLAQTYNAIVVFSFVSSGMTLFWLAYRISACVWSSLVAGFIFTFSNFHFAHAASGHLELIAIEWIPVFILIWREFLRKPSLFLSIGSAFSFILVFASDYYFALYSALAGGFMLFWQAHRAPDRPAFWRSIRLPFLVYVGICLAATGPMTARLWLSHRADPFVDTRDPLLYSLDALALFIPGGHWRFAELTRFYWSRLPGNIGESSVYIGLSVLFIVMYTWSVRRARLTSEVIFWSSSLLFFAVLALGPILQVAGTQLAWVPLPYALIQKLPLIGLSGEPVRMAIMVSLCAALLCAIGLPHLAKRVHNRRYILIVLLGILVFEYWPSRFPISQIPVFPYLAVLKERPDSSGVMDLATTPALAMFGQTWHEKPIAWGYTARVPRTVQQQDDHLIELFHRRDFHRLYKEYDLRYLVLPRRSDFPDAQASKAPPLYQDEMVSVYDLAKIGS
jgi:hypothetical protein